MSRKFKQTVQALLVVCVSCVSCVLLCATSANAYEGNAHATMTGDAFDRSILADDLAGPLTRLGLDHPLTRTFASSGIDRAFSSGNARLVVEFGARFEDLPNSELRFLRHFLDPQNQDRGLTAVGVGPAVSSVEWELEASQSIPEQIYSLRDAEDFYYLALVSAGSAARERYLVLLLEAVGRGVHHLQDMAQPAHTRNDPHPLGLDGDLYEQATEAIADSSSAAFPQGVVYPTAAVDLHTFDTARKFWESAGLGIAELTANNFVSQDTNFASLGTHLSPNDEFPRPAPVACEGRTLINQVRTTDLDLNPKSFSIPGTMWFVGTPVHDHYLSGSGVTLCNERTSAYGLFDFDLEAIGRPKVLALNRYTWTAARDILIPRAIAYSAGFINYVFRGALEIGEIAETAGEFTIDIRNRSLGEFALADGRRTSPAEFEIWYDAADGLRKPAQILSGRDLAGSTVAYGDVHQVRFTRPSDLNTAAAQPFMLVFRGTIGAEEGIAALNFGPQHAGFVVTPGYVTQDGHSGSRSVVRAGSGWVATADASPLAGNVDWRGHDSDDLITWNGPQSRYFLAPGQVNGLSPEIYAHGRLLASAPGGVLGAAIRRGGLRPELLVVVYQNGVLHVHARNLQADAAGSPQWHELYSAPETAPSSPAFANASASEFQLLAGTERLKLHVTQNDVTVERIPSRGTGKQTGMYAGEITPQLCGSNVSESEGYTVSWDRPTVVCADYSGDTEVLCQIDSGAALSETQNLHQALEGVTYRKTGTFHESTSTRRTLKAGHLEIAIRGSDFSTDASTDDSLYPFSDTPPVINDRQVSTTTGYDTRILYLDVRNDVAAYQETNTIRSTSATAANQVIRDIAGYLAEGTYVDENHTQVRLIVEHGGQAEILSDVSSPSAAQRSNPRNPVVNLPCGSSSAETYAGSLEGLSIDDSNFDFSGFIHPRAYQPTLTQGFAVNGDGDFLASLPVISTDARGAEVMKGVWNFLSQGNLPMLLPAAPADSHYFPLGPLQ